MAHTEFVLTVAQIVTFYRRGFLDAKRGDRPQVARKADSSVVIDMQEWAAQRAGIVADACVLDPEKPCISTGRCDVLALPRTGET